jgi:hypothetical protein
LAWLAGYARSALCLGLDMLVRLEAWVCLYDRGLGWLLLAACCAVWLALAGRLGGLLGCFLAARRLAAWRLAGMLLGWLLLGCFVGRALGACGAG